MTTTLIIGMVSIFVFMGVFMHTFTWVVTSGKFDRFRIVVPEFDPLANTRKYIRIAWNGLLAITLYSLFIYFAYGSLIVESEPSVLRVIGEVLVILLIYDFLYYVMHRTFHIPFLMRYVHGRHHKVLHPTTADGLYLDPLDNFGGLGMFFIAIVIVGPIDPITFIVVLFVLILINNINHTGLQVPHPLFALTNYWAQKHEIHHGQNREKNFGTIFPFWDKMFGTYQ